MIARLIIAYLLWLFLGGFSLHRFFLGRVRSGLAQLGLNFGAIVLVVLELQAKGGFALLENPYGLREVFFTPFGIIAIVMSLVGGLWLLLDFFLIVFLVLEDSRSGDQPYDQKSRPGPHARPGAAQTGASRLPDGYVMPWRQEPEDEREIYKARGD